MSAAPLQSLVVPRFITKIPVSQARRAKYFPEKDKETIPKKYRGDNFHFEYGFLVGPNGQRVIANEKTVGTPQYEVLSGNKISTGYGSPFIRSKITTALKDFFRPFARQMTPFDAEDLPLRVEWDVYTTVAKSNWDLSNLWFYYKYFEDCLHEKAHPVSGQQYDAIVPDDSVRFVTHPPGPRLVPVDDFEDRCFVFRFYRDDRPLILTHPLWKHADTEAATATTPASF